MVLDRIRQRAQSRHTTSSRRRREFSMKTVDDLREFLKTQEPGPISAASAMTVQNLLTAAWADLDAGLEGGMKREKLHRIGDAHWDPPVLEFRESLDPDGMKYRLDAWT